MLPKFLGGVNGLYEKELLPSFGVKDTELGGGGFEGGAALILGGGTDGVLPSFGGRGG